MTAIIPSNQSRFKVHSRNKRLTNNGSVQPDGRYTPGLIKHTSKLFLFQDSIAETNLDNRLQAFENSARHKFLTILKTLSFERLPGWLDRMLEQSVLPALHRIGFDTPVARVLFEMAISSWKLMGPLNGKIIAFHPAIIKEIEEVRQGLKVKGCNGSSSLLRPVDATEKTISGTINHSASPENLFDLFDEISTSWTILPRASRFLKKHHCHYLPVYLKTIDRETSDVCLRVFGRIAVEFLGNYSLKFADEYHQKLKLTQLLFYGYAAMFWKTLRCPPKNLENGTAFNNYFNWIKRLARQSEFLGAEENKIIAHMIKLKSMVFPDVNFSSSQNHSLQNNSHFVVTMRHGNPGAAAILKFFGIDQFLTTRQGDDAFQSPKIQSEALDLLRAFQTHYQSESKRTQNYIRQFTNHLKSAYALMQPRFQRTQIQFLNQTFSKMETLFNT